MNIVEHFYTYHEEDSAQLFEIGNKEIKASFNKDFWRHIHNLTASLKRAGIKPGDRVIVLTGVKIATLEVVLGVMNLGAVVVPLNARLGERALAKVIDNSQAVCCVYENLEEKKPIAGRMAESCYWVGINEEDRDDGDLWYGELIDTEQGNPEFEYLADGTEALVVHTSDSGEGAKSIIYSHGALLNFFIYHNLLFSQYTDAKHSGKAAAPIITAIPLLSFGGLALALQAMLMGRALYLMDDFIARDFLFLVNEKGSSTIVVTNPMARQLLEADNIDDLDFSALKFCVLIGDYCPSNLVDELADALNVVVVTAYGKTECQSGIGYTSEQLYEDGVLLGSCGKQLYGKLKLVDSCGKEHDSDGELWVKNPTVIDSYNSPACRQERLIDGWYRTGDHFHRNEEGYYFRKSR